MTMKAFAFLLGSSLAIGCGGDAFTSAGTDSGSDAPSDQGSQPQDGATDAQLTAVDAPPAQDDAGRNCPGAYIVHPASGQARSAGSPVPFIGVGRTPKCEPIVDLVWTDDREGQIGLGETFSYTFTLVGPHTITLTATGRSATYTTSIAFPIN